MAAVKDLRYLANVMPKYAKAIENDVNDFTKEVAQEVQYRVAANTPVDTGKARSNWVMRIGAPFSFVYNAFSPGVKLGRGETANLSAVRRQGAAVAATYKTGSSIYISNNVPYIGRLNNGYSQQSPSGFVQNGVSVGMRTALTRFRWKNLNKI